MVIDRVVVAAVVVVDDDDDFDFDDNLLSCWDFPRFFFLKWTFRIIEDPSWRDDSTAVFWWWPFTICTVVPKETTHQTIRPIMMTVNPTQKKTERGIAEVVVVVVTVTVVVVCSIPRSSSLFF